MEKIILIHQGEKSFGIKTGETTQSELFSIVALVNELINDTAFNAEDISTNIQNRLDLNVDLIEIVAVVNI